MASKHDFVAQGWAAGMSKTEIASATGYARATVNKLLVTFRKAGDARAAKRGRIDGRKHDRMGIYRTRAESQQLKEDVLNSWAAGECGNKASKRLGITRDHLDTLLRRARRAGDPRAEFRYDRGWSRVIGMPHA